MPDRLFTEPRLARLYDAFCADRPDFAFYLPLIMGADAVLDIGCGTGSLLRLERETGHRGRLCGIDPAEAMLDQARVCSEVEWHLGDVESAPWAAAFELVVMTGHAFQVLVEDEQIRRSLRAVHRALVPGGRFVFETRNPAVRGWEKWVPENAAEIATADGERIRMAHQVETRARDVVTFTVTYSCPGWERDEVSWSALRFLDAATVTSHLHQAGLVVESQLGSWGGGPFRAASEEIITIARRR